jgi:hypothetical protein
MQTATRDTLLTTARRARRGTHIAALWGLFARGVLYLVLAFLAFGLAFGHHSGHVDARGALHELADGAFGTVLLVALAVGFAGFALWHAYEALTGGGPRAHEASQRVANAARAVVYGALCAVAVSFVVSAHQAAGDNSDQADKTWTARALDWTGGRWLVGAVGLAVIAAGIYLLVRAATGEQQDEAAVLDAAPREPAGVHVLGIVGNVARGAVVVMVGAFLLDAAVEHDPNRTVGIDGALQRITAHAYESVLAVLVAIGFAAFGLYSIARAAVNRSGA